jgi:hypothetical protein
VRACLLTILTLSAGLFLSQDSVRYPFEGWLGGEPFFNGMPVCYWRDSWRIATRRADASSPLQRLLDEVNDSAAQWYRARRRARDQAKADGALEMTRQSGAVPVLAALAQDPDEAVRYAAFWCLGGHGSAAQPALDVLLASFSDGSPRCRVAAAYAAARATASSEARAVRLLVHELQEPESVDSAAFFAAFMLNELGDRPAVREALPQLAELSKEPRLNWKVRSLLVALEWRLDHLAAGRAGLPWPDLPIPLPDWLARAAQPDPCPGLTIELRRPPA